jgi:iron complex outermembrane receptor protein
LTTNTGDYNYAIPRKFTFPGRARCHCHDADPAVAINQTEVNDFLTTNLFVGHDFAGTGMAEGLSLRFNVDNVFDEEPPVYRSNQGVNYSGWTLGRVYKLGLTYEF